MQTQITLSQLLAPMNMVELLTWANKLDPNNSWSEWLADDPRVDTDTMRDAMLEAYDDNDTYHWINQ